MKRRTFLTTTAVGAVAAATLPQTVVAQTKMVAPWDWVAEHGLVNHLRTDTDPLTNEFEKYPRCPYCGMVRKAFSFSRHLIVYEDDSVDGTCSIHCAGISLALNMDRGPKAIYVGDAGSDAEVKPLINALDAFYVLDSNKMGTMTAHSKFAYADQAAATAAAVNGATIVDFDTALTEAYLDTAKGTIAIRKRRAEKRKAMAARNG